MVSSLRLFWSNFELFFFSDSTEKGKELRLKQQYFFASASLQDILRRFKQNYPDLSLDQFSNKCAIQLNDTHPTVSIPELMRLLIDENNMGWDAAWKVCSDIVLSFSQLNSPVFVQN